MNKRFIVTALALMLVAVIGIFALAACAEPDADEDAQEYIKVVDASGAEIEVPVNPTRVAVYDYSTLDILNNVDFTKTGIEQLIVPTKSSLPEELKYYADLPGDKVISGGSLFYVDWDVLDLVQPQLVILGGRSFGMDADGNRLGTDAAAEFRESTYARYSNTKFIKLSVNSTDSSLVPDMERNAGVLAKIFNKVSVDGKLNEIKNKIADIKTKAEASESTALFCMMVDQTTLSVFNVGSRFDMLYEDFGFTPVDPNAEAWTDAHGLTARAEYVLEQNPDVIFVLDRSATVGTGGGFANLMADEVIKQTEAYKNGHIYVLSGNAWYTMTGGFTAAEAMVADLQKYFDDLED
ncbi:MAG: ABC transporter substrate-binding protein [Christensenellaceae bacterium]|jgi:iron complex transport system substrate-binding protein|nr:ABC transporter substrate-binding protein [Christensenellaceae bacterium]